MIIGAEVMIFVVFECAVHDLKELIFSRIVDFPDFGLDLMEPHLNRIELWGVRW